jgi:hypothetical protein
MNKSLLIFTGLFLMIKPASALTFHGYECTDDCSGHEAGYSWAEKKGVANPDDCGGNSQSFIEGCKAWAGEDGPEDDNDGKIDDQAED